MSFLRFVLTSRSPYSVGTRNANSLLRGWRYFTSSTQQQSVAVSLFLRHGKPMISFPLPSTQQHCDMTIRPLTDTVGHFLDHIRAEDGGITSTSLYATDGNRLASSTLMHQTLSSDFDLEINEVKYRVSIPDEYDVVVDDSDGDHVKNVVQRLYTALHTNEHQLKKRLEMRTQLEQLRSELSPLDQQRVSLNEATRRRTNMLLWTGLGAMSVQFGFFARLTWADYSWDIMEPITYFTTCATLIGMYVYFALVRQEYIYNGTEDRMYLKRFHWLARKRGFDINKYNSLKDSIGSIECELKRLEGPMNYNLPTPPLDTQQ